MALTKPRSIRSQMISPCLATVIAPAKVITTKQSLSRAMASSTSTASPRRAKWPAGELGVRHTFHQLANALDLGKVERENRREFVLHRIVQFAVNACALALFGQRFTSVR